MEYTPLRWKTTAIKFKIVPMSSALVRLLSSITVLLFLGEVSAEPAHNGQLGFQTPASPIAEGIISFHDDLLVFLTLIICFVFYILTICMVRFGFNNQNGSPQRLTHASTLEIVWTLIPAAILILIAIPSFSLLYSVDEIVEPLFTIKVVGHQWYWSYEFLDPEVVAQLYNDTLRNENLLFEAEGSGSFDSYMLSDDELAANEGLSSYRLLTVDNHLFVPTEMNVRAMVTAADVLHSWAIPSLGIKLDACPGRLNQTSLFIKREGLYYGQCSEICGVNHGFMPIGIVSQEFFSGVKPTALDLEPLLVALQAIALE
jgi:cytochrome c oxidase subunit 2